MLRRALRLSGKPIERSCRRRSCNLLALQGLLLSVRMRPLERLARDEDAEDLPHVVDGQGEMSFVIGESRAAVRNLSRDVLANRDRDVPVAASMPEVHPGADVLQPEPPRTLVERRFVTDPVGALYVRYSLEAGLCDGPRGDATPPLFGLIDCVPSTEHTQSLTVEDCELRRCVTNVSLASNHLHITYRPHAVPVATFAAKAVSSR